MVWIFLSTVLVLLVFSPGFRKFGLLLACFAVVIGTIGGVIVCYLNEREAKEADLSQLASLEAAK